MSRSRRGWLLLGILVGLGVDTIGPGPAHAGLIVFTTTDVGDANGEAAWATQTQDLPPIFPLGVIAGTDIDGPFTDFDFPTVPGTYTYTLFADGLPPVSTAFFGLNFFFEPDQPGISVYAELFGPFFANSGSTLDLNGNPVPGAGTLSHVVGSHRVSLTDFHWLASLTDRVSTTGLNPNGFPDYIGFFTLEVTAVPEPSTLGLAVVGGVGLLGTALSGWRLRNRKGADPRG